MGAPCSLETTTIQRLPVQPVKLALKIVDQRLWRARLKRDFELAILEAHQPHVALQRHLGRDVALVGGKRDQLLE